MTVFVRQTGMFVQNASEYLEGCRKKDYLCIVKMK